MRRFVIALAIATLAGSALTGCITPPAIVADPVGASPAAQPPATPVAQTPPTVASPAPPTPEEIYLTEVRRGLAAIGSDMESRLGTAGFEGAVMGGARSWCGSLASNPRAMTDHPEFLEAAAAAVVEQGLMSREEFFVLTNAANEHYC